MLSKSLKHHPTQDAIDILKNALIQIKEVKEQLAAAAAKTAAAAKATKPTADKPPPQQPNPNLLSSQLRSHPRNQLGGGNSKCDH